MDEKIDNRLKKIPEIDEKNMLTFHFGEYNSTNHIFFTYKNRDKILESTLTEPKLSSSYELMQEILIEKNPLIDITSKSSKILFATTNQIKYFYLPIPQDILKSFVFHFSIILCYFVTNYISLFKRSEPEVVEITFGLTDKLVQTQQEVLEKKQEGQTEATRTKEDLPQLTKNASPNTGPKPSSENETFPTNKDNNLVIKESKKIPPPVPPTKKEKQDFVSKQDGKKVNDNKNKITEKEYLIRKEEDLRKIALEKKQGIHGKIQTQPDGQKQIFNSLPKSPFQSAEDIPQAPPGLAPTGAENGINVANYNAYLLFLKNQLRLNWNLNEGSSFPKNLKSVIEFTINPFGHLINKPKILQSSGNKDFDGIALKALQETFPVSTPPPKSIHPPQTFKATYSAKNVE